MTTPTTNGRPEWSEMLQAAVNEPGRLNAAYHAFHTYSFRNQLAASWQLSARGIPVGPIAPYKTWQSRGRQVRRGEKAIFLCRPATVPVKPKEGETVDPDAAPKMATFFMWEPKWFALAQTDGDDYTPPPTPGWDRSAALAALEISEEPFAHTNGNVMGYARERTIAVSPLNPLPHKTTFHEMAHVLLGHTDREMNDGAQLPTDERECEAEAVAMLCCATLELPGVEESRSYIQGWYGTGRPIAEKMAQRIIATADKILKAGKEEPAA